MKLKCRIHEKEYDIVAGATFAEEYNETLDSGSIIIDQIKKIKGLKPYDDVYIWNADQNFNGYVNVGDTVSAEAFGVTASTSAMPYYLGAPITQKITDTYLMNSFPTVQTVTQDDGTDKRYIEFKSYKYSENGKSFPNLIDAWASNFLYTIVHYNSSVQQSGPRWNINSTNKFTLKVTYLPLFGILPTLKTAYYYLPSFKGNGVDSRGKLILKKDTSYNNPSGAPDELHIEYELFEPNQSWYIGPFDSIYANSPRLRLMTGIATSNDGEMLITNAYNVSNFQMAENTDYSYYYYYMSSTSTDAIPSLEFEIDGLTKEQVLALENIEVDLSAGGYSYKGICSHPVADENNQNTINMHFDLEIDAQNDGDGFDIVLQKDSNSNTKWSVPAQSTLSVTWQSTNYPVDQITNQVLDGLKMYVDNSQVIRNFLPRFFKHFLVDNLKWEMLSLETNSTNRLYKCKLDLMSETKRLEKVILPNVSITQPIVGNKRSVWYYLNQFVDLYSPKIKMQDENNNWVYKNKYKIDARSFGDYFINSNDNNTIRNANDLYINIPVHEIFDDSIFAPEMSLTAPTLKDVLSRLMIVKDCIPIVKNDVIYAMKISETHGDFVINNDNFSFIAENMNSANYSTAFRREYGGAISQNNTAHLVEFLGFRTAGSGEGLMTLSNMVLETRFPIYKINKLYMCYYKTATVRRISNNSTYTKLVLVKQDITKLVLQNTVRNLLPADWTTVQNGAWQNISVDQMAQHRIFTLGYSIGSNIISGWGENVHYISDKLGWAETINTYIELIFRKMNNLYTWGISNYQFLSSNEELVSASSTWYDIISPNNSLNLTDKLKSLFFEMDYTAMYSGAIIHSKENTEDDDIMTPDNCSSALSILEVDGLFEREKANRLANTEFSFIARFDDVHEMNSVAHNNILGAEYKGEDETAIIYHREYQIYDDCVLANFAGTHDYVLKNYFTTVFAKYRTYSYAGYDENINRAETDKYLIFLSDDRCYYEDDDNGLKQQIITSVLSAFSPTTIGDDLNPQFPNQINGGYFTFEYRSSPSVAPVQKGYFSDVNQFVSGYSLCFNIKMYDNITNGNYIVSINCWDNGTKDSNSAADNYVGSQLEWHKMPLSETDGFVKNVGCYFGHFESKDYYSNYVNWGNHTAAQVYDKIFKLPYKNINAKFAIGKIYDFCKDNKEKIDFTLQYELVNQDNNLIVSEWLMKLTNFNNYLKLPVPTTVNDKTAQAGGFTTKFWARRGSTNILLANYGWYEYDQCIRVIFSSTSVEQDNILQSGTVFSGAESGYYESKLSYGVPGQGIVTTYTLLKITLDRIISVTTESGNITRIRVRAVLDDTTETTSVEIDLQRDTNASGYEFVYIGQIAPSGFLSDQTRISLNYGFYDSEGNAQTVYCSVILSQNPYNFPRTMYVLVSDRDIEQQLVYEQYKLAEIPDHMAIVDTVPTFFQQKPSFADIFSIKTDDVGRPYIKYHCADSINNTSIPSGNPYKSVQYWYYDVEGDGYLHFVFGINAYEKDSEGNDVLIEDRKIYISTLKNRNTKVYNYLHREIGKVMNFAEPANATSYGQQLFEFNEDEEED